MGKVLVGTAPKKIILELDTDDVAGVIRNRELSPQQCA